VDAARNAAEPVGVVADVHGRRLLFAPFHALLLVRATLVVTRLPDRSTNCGRKARKKRAVLGFNTFTITPCVNRR
jgi:hypothetical protein